MVQAVALPSPLDNGRQATTYASTARWANLLFNLI
jgi:hypothetical protein